MEALLYCNKGKPYLYLDSFADVASEYSSWYQIPEEAKGDTSLIKLGNGKVVAEIEYDLEDIKFIHVHKGGHYTWYEYKGVNITDPDCERDICKESCMEFDDFFDVSRNNRTGLPGDCKAYMIKDIKIFDDPKDIQAYMQGTSRGNAKFFTRVGIKTVDDVIDIFNGDSYKHYKLIRCSSKELYRILNGEQTIIVRKK